jgi:hypothetical protein
VCRRRTTSVLSRAKDEEMTTPSGPDIETSCYKWAQAPERDSITQGCSGKLCPACGYAFRARLLTHGRPSRYLLSIPLGGACCWPC